MMLEREEEQASQQPAKLPHISGEDQLPTLQPHFPSNNTLTSTCSIDCNKQALESLVTISTFGDARSI